MDDIVPLAVRTESVLAESLGDILPPNSPVVDVRSGSVLTDTNMEDIISPDFPIPEVGSLWLPQYSPEELRGAQMNDPDLAKIIQWLEDKNSPTP